MLSSRVALVVLVAGLALSAAGAALFVLVPAGPVGWFAYTPLPETAVPQGMVLGTAQRWGAALAVVGLVALSWAAGYGAGRRAQRRP